MGEVGMGEEGVSLGTAGGTTSSTIITGEFGAGGMGFSTGGFALVSCPVAPEFIGFMADAG